MSTYQDIDLSFTKHPQTGDVLRLYDYESIKQALRDIFFTNKFEKPFEPDYGLGINGFLFENYSPIMDAILKRKINEQLTRFDGRIFVDNIVINSEKLDNNELIIELYFHVVGTTFVQQLNMVIQRVR